MSLETSAWTPPSPASDGALATAPAGDLSRHIQAGDRGAEAELVHRFGEGIAFLLRRSCRERETADDLYQETFRLAIEKIRRGEVRDPERLAAFLRGLAKNLSIDHYRGRARREAREVATEGIVEALPADSPADLPQLSRLLAAEKATLVRRLLAEMGSQRDRQVLLRFYLGEEEREDIRADLGLSAPEFNLILFRAKRRYRELFERAAGRAARGT